MNEVLNRKPVLSVVLSFWNEEDVIPELIGRLRKAADDSNCDLEMVFVDDCSTDNSLNILLDEQKKSNDIKVMKTSRNFGHMPCIMAGMEACTGDAVVYMDADLQDPPELIPEMVDAWLKDGYEVVFTTRTHRDGETWLKLFITGIGYKILKWTTDIEIHENSGDFRLLTRKALNHYIKFKEKKPFFRFLVSWIGFKQKQIFYRREPRAAGDTKFPLFSKKVFIQFLEISMFPFSDMPLKIILLFGLIVAFFAFLYLLIVIAMKIFGLALPGWSAIMATVLFLGAIQLIVLGIQGFYIAAIHAEVKGRPNYIISEKFGFEKKYDE